ncbi:MAG: replication-associated recombination protein A [Phycisphaerales bacterium]|nr:replication-associated recombination protein A [Phycisphaerales bacterium]
MPDLFAEESKKMEDAIRPLADRMRPQQLSEVVGQQHILGDGMLLPRMISADRLTSIVFWGPPGTGKTTLASVIANETDGEFLARNAAQIGVAEIRTSIEQAKERVRTSRTRTIIFLDEIHRFSKTQQDVLLDSVEQGTVILIGATTENPGYTVNDALVSRSTVFHLEPLDACDIELLINRAIQHPRGFGSVELQIEQEAIHFIAHKSDGDARAALNAIEVAVLSTPSGHITLDIATQSMQQKSLRYDRSASGHYDHASAFIKSMRASDVNGALYWLACMLESGEDPRFIARRASIFASEDIGLADPRAIEQAAAAWQIIERVGMPECKLTLSQLVIYLCQAPKSRNAYDAMIRATDDVKNNRTVVAPTDHNPDALPTITSQYYSQE